ncbi:MAG TPA: acetamidase [Synergistaceae bacterium]|jgi:acetamidase/formamidase|nr:acetamidase [Synergistaceae bacterium]
MTEKTCSGTVFVNQFTDGVLDPSKPMLGPVRDGGYIVANTAPGCWGPMITPELKGGHEVTVPVAVEGAEVGDAIAIRIKDVTVTSAATASGNDQAPDAARFRGDPFVAKQCPSCGAYHPKTVLEGIGQKAVRCASCGAEISPFAFTNGYTVVFDHERGVAVTLDKKGAERVAKEGDRYSAKPDRSVQNPILVFAPSDLVGAATRLRPFLGQLGTTPSLPFPDSHNAGDFGAFLVGAPHEYTKTEEQLAHRTDGHMDVNHVRAGAVLICPVKVKGGGVYVGDMHAFQGNGEIAGHTADVSGIVTLQVEVVKGLAIDGPILFPVAEDLPYLAKPLSCAEKEHVRTLAGRWGVEDVERTAPVTFIGTGANMNAAIDNGLERASKLLGLSLPEVKNRATIAGAIEIGRAPGVVMVTFRCPVEPLERLGLLPFAQEQYDL